MAKTAERRSEFCHDLRAHPRTRTIPLILVAETELHSRIATVRAEALLKKPLDQAFSRDISLSGAFIKSDRPVRCAAVVRSGPMLVHASTAR